MKIIGKFVCWATGKHKRGKKLPTGLRNPAGDHYDRFRCPRCDHTWTRKVTVKNENKA